MFNIGEIVTVEDPFHRRGASVGVIETITDLGWFQVWWESDGENQIHPAARTYEGYELKLLEENFGVDIPPPLNGTAFSGGGILLY